MVVSKGHLTCNIDDVSQQISVHVCNMRVKCNCNDGVEEQVRRALSTAARDCACNLWSVHAGSAQRLATSALAFVQCARARTRTYRNAVVQT